MLRISKDASSSPGNLFKCLAPPLVRNFLFSNIYARCFEALGEKLQYEDKYYYYLTYLSPR